MNSVPPHINTDPCPPIERPYYSPAQEPLASPDTVPPGIQTGRPTWQQGQHLWSYQRRILTDKTRFGIQGFMVLMLGLLQLLCLRWGRTALMACYLVLLLAAPYYANHLRLHHLFARFVRRVFFHIYAFPDDPDSARILPRTFPLMFIPISSIVLLFWP